MKLRYLALVPMMVLAACSNVGGGADPEFYNGQAGTTASQTATDLTTVSPTSPQFFSQTVGDRVLFNVDEFVVADAAKPILDAQASWLNSNPSYQIIIEGHADEQGTREYNLALGFRRARSVQEYLVARGVSHLRLRTRSFGKERPVEICSVEECYSKNRRAVTVLVGGSTS